MAESRIRDDNFYMIGGWMINRLGLKGTPLQIFAIVYGFSQDGKGYFDGSLQYLCDFTGTSKPTVIKALQELTEQGYIIKEEQPEGGGKRLTYRANRDTEKRVSEASKETLPVKKLYEGGKETLPDAVKKLYRGGKETLPNNKEDNIVDNIEDKEERGKTAQRIADLFNEICISFPRVRSLSEARKKAIRARLNTYTVEDFETVFRKAEASSFMKGRNSKNWMATFDWMIRDGNMAKVLDGNYDERPKAQGKDTGFDTNNPFLEMLEERRNGHDL